MKILNTIHVDISKVAAKKIRWKYLVYLKCNIKFLLQNKVLGCCNFKCSGALFRTHDTLQPNIYLRNNGIVNVFDSLQVQGRTHPLSSRAYPNGHNLLQRGWLRQTFVVGGLGVVGAGSTCKNCAVYTLQPKSLQFKLLSTTFRRLLMLRVTVEGIVERHEGLTASPHEMSSQSQMC